jgi:hypothetical protein
MQISLSKFLSGNFHHWLLASMPMPFQGSSAAGAEVPHMVTKLVRS